MTLQALALVSSVVLFGGYLVQAALFSVLLARTSAEGRRRHRTWVSLGLAAVACFLVNGGARLDIVFHHRTHSSDVFMRLSALVDIGLVCSVASMVALVRLLASDSEFQHGSSESGRE